MVLALGTRDDDAMARLRAGEATSLVLLTATALGMATCPITESALIRLLLNPLVAGRTFAPGLVLNIVTGLGADPRWRWLSDESTLARPLIDTSVLGGYRQVTDLHLVNLAATAGLQLVTFDAGLAAGLAPPDRRHVRLLDQ